MEHDNRFGIDDGRGEGALRPAPVECAGARSVTAAFLASGSRLKRFLSRYLRLRQDIDDVVQEAYLRAYVAEQRESIEEPVHFLFRVARNLALNRLARKSRRITDYIEEASLSLVAEAAAGSDEELEAEESLGLYCEAIAALPEKCRQAFLLRKVHGLSHQEIGEQMNLSISSVEKYLRQGLRHCQAYISERHGSRPCSQAQFKRGA